MSTRLFLSLSIGMVFAISVAFIAATDVPAADTHYDHRAQEGYLAFQQRDAMLSMSREHLSNLAPAAGDISKN